MGQHLVTHDPCDPSGFCDPFNPWRPIKVYTEMAPRADYDSWSSIFFSVFHSHDHSKAARSEA